MSPARHIWIDGLPTDKLPLPDRGLDFGDGLFETMLLRRGDVLYPDAHLGRLRRGLGALSFPDCASDVRSYVTAASLACADADWSALRVSVTRGSGPRGYAPPRNTQPRCIVTTSHLQRDCYNPGAPVHIGTSRLRCGHQPALAGLKHLNRLEQVLAARQADEEGLDEMLMLDQVEHVVGVTAGNIFILRDSVLYTPDVAKAGVAGTRRQLLLERWAPALGLTVIESVLTRGDVATAEEVFYTNALWGPRPIGDFEESHWAEHPVCAALFEQYRRDIPR